MTPPRAGKRSVAGRAPRSRLERIRCADCDAIVGGRVPKNGDGTGLLPVWHKHNGEPCEGRFSIGRPLSG